MAKALVLNSSPRRDRGGTGQVLAPMVAGMRAAGAEVELAYPHGMAVGYCRGCYHCWTATPGRCVQRDDMDALLPQVADSDILVLATPLYVDGMNAAMKAVLDRLIPVLQPFIVEHEDHCRHDLVPGCRAGRVALVSVCGFSELDNFEPLVAHVKAACRNLRREYAGALLRPYAGSLAGLARHGLAVGEVLDACREAGRELVRDGRISEATATSAGRELVSRRQHIAAVNHHFRAAISRNRPAGA
ncbi:MAG: flavodoxin family protein [bacterium]